MKVRVLCPAKVNLFLSVGAKDARGYHPIRTIFQAVSLYDELVIEDGVSETTISSEWALLPAENTLTKTLRLASEYCTPPALSIRLTKQIPVQSGLGGGSSDAAGLLRALDHFLITPLEDFERSEIAKAVGADVPFFLVGGCAKGEGYGEKLTPLPFPGPQWMVIVMPEGARCSTVEAYNSLDEKSFEWRDFPNGEDLYNDFERVAPCESLELIERLQAAGAASAGLTGSGAAVFGIFRSHAEAERGFEQMQREGLGTAYLVQTLDSEESLVIEAPAP